MSDPNLTVEQITTLLTEHPQKISAAAAGLTFEQLNNPPNPGEWSPRDILAHLRACGDVWGGGLVELVEKDHPTIRAISPRTWIKRTDYLQQEFHPSLEAYLAQRAELLDFIHHMKPEDWSRTATVSVAGKPLTRTVYWYGVGLAAHERSHVKQIMRIAKAMQARSLPFL